MLDIHVAVESIDEGSAVISRRVFGSSVVRLENEFESIESGGPKYITRMTLGDDTLSGRLLLNRVARTRAYRRASSNGGFVTTLRKSAISRISFRICSTPAPRSSPNQPVLDMATGVQARVGQVSS